MAAKITPQPSWWLLGPSCFESVREQPVATTAALEQLLAPSRSSRPTPPAAASAAPTPPPDSMTQRRRLEPPKFDVRQYALNSERRRGQALYRREDVERKMMAEQRAIYRDRERVLAEAQAAMLAAGSAELASTGAEAETAGGKRKKDKEEATPVQSKQRKPVAPMTRVEVALHEEEMASWYQGTILQETKTRSKVKLLVMPQAMGGSGNDGEDEYLIIEGRKDEESVGNPLHRVRPVPPVDRSWAPTVGENCELLYLDGWWPVRAQSVKGDKWSVLYEAFGVQHVVSKAQLRKRVVWDPETRLWKV
eukprot:scaffold14274_cov65-Phaeocystis_antarctica.AAC.2